MDGLYPTSPLAGAPHLRGHRRASEASLASQVSGMADSYTASNIATSTLIQPSPLPGLQTDAIVLPWTVTPNRWK